MFSFVCDSCLLMNNVSLLTRPFEILVQIPHLRPTEYKRSRLPRNRRTVNRAYGGVLSGSAVRERYFTFVLGFWLLSFTSPLSIADRILMYSFTFCCNRIIRAFLVEEQKIVKKVLKIQKAKEKLASKS